MRFNHQEEIGDFASAHLALGGSFRPVASRQTLRRNETEQRFDDSTAVRRQKSIKRTPSQLLLEKQQAGVGIWWPELIQFWDLEARLRLKTELPEGIVVIC